MENIFLLLMLIIITLIYFLPVIIASGRNHKNLWMLSVLNVFLGWTVLCWFLFMIWAMLGETNKSTE